MIPLKQIWAKRVVLFAHEVGINRSSFEGDSEIVINSLRCGDKLSSYFGHIIRDTFSSSSSLLSCSFFSFPFSLSFFFSFFFPFLTFSPFFFYFVRQSNVVSNVLVKKARLFFSLFIWM